jgi:soluble lytic murein transglycosylase-like protein
MKDSKVLNLKILTPFGFIFLLSLLTLALTLRAGARTGPDTVYDGIIKKIAGEHGLEPSLIHSIIRAESNYNPSAISSKGAMGLMQLMPETAEKYGVKNPLDPEENIQGGIKYLKDLINLFGRKTEYVLAAYNAGQEALKRNGGIPPYPETRDYIEKVMASYPRSYIRKRTEIYKFYDASGNIVLTNCRYIYSSNKGKEEDG